MLLQYPYRVFARNLWTNTPRRVAARPRRVIARPRRWPLRRGTRMTREAAEEMAEREVEEGGRVSLGEAGYERALEEGERLSLERALEIVRGAGAGVIDHPAISR